MAQFIALLSIYYTVGMPRQLGAGIFGITVVETSGIVATWSTDSIITCFVGRDPVRIVGSFI